MVASDSDEVLALRAELERMRERMLDLEEQLAKSEEQQEVLENVCFANEREHEKARQVVEATQAKLVESYNLLSELKAQQDDILATVDQGICTINTDGVINAECSAMMHQIFGRDVAGLSLPDLVSSDETLLRRIRRHLTALFSSTWMNSRSLARLNPIRELQMPVTRADGEIEIRHLTFTFARIAGREVNGRGPLAPAKVLCVVNDRTVEHQLQAEIRRKSEETATKLEKMYRILALPPSTFTSFLEDADATLRALDTFLEHAGKPDQAGDVIRARLRDLHALKGNARAMGLDTIATAAHECESTLVAAGDRPDGEQVHTIQRAVRTLHAELEDGTNLFARILDMRDALDNAGRLRIAEIEELVRNLVAGEGSRLGKNVSLRFECGSDTTLPGHVAVRVRNALIQMVRNAIAHGIEPSAERSRLGKDPTGAIKVSLTRSEGGLTVTCVDDGRGVDFAALEVAARERGLLTDTASITPQDLLFIPGLSTTEREDALSGRGIGMDLVRDSVDALGGRVLVDSAPGAFTQITLEIPTDMAQPRAPGERDEGIGGR